MTYGKKGKKRALRKPKETLPKSDSDELLWEDRHHAVNDNFVKHVLQVKSKL